MKPQIKSVDTQSALATLADLLRPSRYQHIKKKIAEIQPGEILECACPSGDQERVRNSIQIYLRKLRRDHPNMIWDKVFTRRKNETTFYVIAKK